MKLKIISFLVFITFSFVGQAASNNYGAELLKYNAPNFFVLTEKNAADPIILALCGTGGDQRTVTPCPACSAGFHNVNGSQICTKKTDAQGGPCSNSSCTACLCAPN